MAGPSSRPIAGPRADTNPNPAQLLQHKDEAPWPLSFSVNLTAITPRWWSHYLYRGPKGEKVQLLYSNDLETSEKVARKFLNEPVLGFDMEWPWDDHRRTRLQEKIGLIQVACQSKIALFHIGRHEGTDPEHLIAPSLRRIIESSEYTKTGVAIMDADFSRLVKHFKLQPRGAFELSHLHRLVTYGQTTPHEVNTKLCALKTQVELHLGLLLWKGKERTSNWSLPLDAKQIQYAADDAYASFMLYHRMNAKRLAMHPIPPLPLHAELYLPFRMPPVTTIQLNPLQAEGPVVTAKDFFGSTQHIQESGDVDASQAEADVDEEPGAPSQASARDNDATMAPPAASASQPQVKPVKPAPKPKKSVGPVNLDPESKELYERLAKSRFVLSEAASCPAYVVAHNTMLETLARERPTTKAAMLKVRGFGKSKLEKFGDEWLRIIRGFDAEKKKKKTAQQVPPSTPVQKSNPRRSQAAGQEQAFTPTPPQVVHTGLSFQFQSTNLDEEPKFRHLEELDDDSVFGSPIPTPSKDSLKRKRTEATPQPQSPFHNQPSESTQSVAAHTPTKSAPVIHPSSSSSTRHHQPHPTSSQHNPAEIVQASTKPHPPYPSSSQVSSQHQPQPLTGQTRILHSKLGAIGRRVTTVLKLEPQWLEAIFPEAVVRRLVAYPPKTIWEMERTPGITAFVRACADARVDLFRIAFQPLLAPKQAAA